MSNKPSESTVWTPLEIRLLNTLDIFEHKPIIMKKAETNLIKLKNSIVNELPKTSHLYPPKTDTIKGQIVRGENHKGFPFISLDMPQMFSKTDMFTYRTLFWWGHDLIFSLIIKQENLAPLINTLVTLIELPGWEDVHLAIAPSPWEWERKSNNFTPLSETSEKDIRKVLETIRYIKLCRFYSLSDPSFPNLNWTSTGLTLWKTFSKVYTN